MKGLSKSTKFRWLLPGVRIKRYLFTIFLGIALLTYGFVVVYLNVARSNLYSWRNIFLLNLSEEIPFGKFVIPIAGILFFVFAVSLIVVGIKELLSSISTALVPDKDPKEIMDIVFGERKEGLKKRVVVIGGGTGTTSVLSGLRDKFVKISAIITVADTGGSSGILRKELKMPPPGDIRNCLIALSEERSFISRLLSFRFRKKGSFLDGHNLGNILIAGLTKMTGDFGDAVLSMSKILSINGEVMPFTTEDITLCAEFEDGNIVRGEIEITNYRGKIKRIFIEPESAKPYIRALERISQADVIVIGPGSLYTSIVPPLLLPSIADTVRRSRAKKVYVSNIMTEPGETDHFTAYDHIKVITDILGDNVVEYALLNKMELSNTVAKKYMGAGAEVVEPNISEIQKTKIKCIVKNFTLERGDVVRHNPEKLAETITNIMAGKV
ncbi:MAG: uridine diphosphate-N-acetylglucosamine-binding protein YvcK [Caldisericota bacterium]|nr:uridine diphosphate-N-acetylglucosamine-binding protein YvcK [Caldisericota bacterium]